MININTEKNPKTYEAGIDLREERDASTVAVGDFNTSLPKSRKTSKQKFSNETGDLSNTIINRPKRHRYTLCPREQIQSS